MAVVVTIFITRQRTDARNWCSNSVCPSVCQSAVFQYRMDMA